VIDCLFVWGLQAMAQTGSDSSHLTISTYMRHSWGDVASHMIQVHTPAFSFVKRQIQPVSEWTVLASPNKLIDLMSRVTFLSSHVTSHSSDVTCHVSQVAVNNVTANSVPVLPLSLRQSPPSGEHNAAHTNDTI
jgi:hypothetical protein